MKPLRPTKEGPVIAAFERLFAERGLPDAIRTDNGLAFCLAQWALQSLQALGLSSVAEALARYIDTVRPPTSFPEVFIRLRAPRCPLTPGGIYHVVRQRVDDLGIQIAHRGPHALRHACATRLVAEGMTLKEIGDHLGHRSSSTTRIYTKVDLTALREVGDFDLGDLP